MKRRSVTVAQLANEADMDVEDALISLWYNGFPDIPHPQHRFTKQEIKAARKALQLPTRREYQTAQYWRTELGLKSDHEFQELLGELEIETPVRPNRLSLKAIRRLRKKRREIIQPQLEQIQINPEPQYEPYHWEIIGQKKHPLHRLTSDQVNSIHYCLVDDFKGTNDPLNPPGVRSHELLESAVSRPATSFGDLEKYPTVEMAAAALLHSLVHNHPFHNGNKRTALVAMLVTLDQNGLVLTCTKDDLFKLVLKLARHGLTNGPTHELADREVMEVARWLERNIRELQKGERPVEWRKLKKLLGRYGCSFEFPTQGNRINITRSLSQKDRRFRFWRHSRNERVLSSQVRYASEGSEAARNTVHKIRKDLELDEEHGIDSGSFYFNLDVSQSEFIHRYRKTLIRLAKL